MREADVKIFAKLYALDYMVANLFVRIHKAQKTTPERIIESHNELLSMLSHEAVPQLDPAMSDHVSDEFKSSVAEILAQIEEMAGVRRT